MPNEEIERMQAQIALEQLNISKRLAYIEEYKTNIEPAERRALANYDAGTTFVEIATKSSYILNGGAVVAVPTFLSVFGAANEISQSSVVISVGLFVFGLVLITASTILTHLNFRAVHDSISTQRDIDLLAVSAEHSTDQSKEMIAARAEQRGHHLVEKEISEKRTGWTFVAAWTTGLASFATFVAGAITLLIDVAF